MGRFRALLGTLAVLALLVAAGALVTASQALAQANNVRPAPNFRPPSIVAPRLLPRIIAPGRVLPADQGPTDGARQAKDDTPANADPTPSPKPPAARRAVSRQPAPGEPNPRPVFFADDLDANPLGLFLAGPYDPDIVLVSLAGDADAALADDIAFANGLELVEQLPMPLLAVQFVRYRLPAGATVREAVEALVDYPGVLDVQPNYYYGPAAEVAATSIQYAPQKIRAGEAHEIAMGRNVLVAVIDSGIDAQHPELEKVAVESFDAIDFDPADEKRHGTAMAAVIAANSQLMGIAPSVKLLSARAFGVPKGGSKALATTFAILKSMQWSFDRGARIFNLSFAGPRDPALIKGLDALAAHDVIMVAAAGNAGPNAPPAYPGAHSGVIAVTATDTADVLFSMANNGKYIALAAPGVDVMTATPGKRYELVSGTSVAAAHVTGVVALMMEREPSLKPAMVRQRLADSAIDLGPEGPDSGYGAGLVDALGALKQTSQSPIVAAD